VKVYIAGKITGDPGYRAKFAAAEAALKAAGHIPLNPAVLPDGLEEADYMRIAFVMLDAADMAAFLPDWIESEGTMVERAYCRRIGKPCGALEEVCAVRKTI